MEVKRPERKIVVAGAASMYMSVGVPGFPLRYEPTSEPVWMRGGVSGAAGHIAATLRRLGDPVDLCTVVGHDEAGVFIRRALRHHGLLGAGVVGGAESSLGVVLVGPDGSRMGLPYLEPVNEVAYPPGRFRRVARGADLAVLTNARFVRPLLPYAEEERIPIAVDVHLIEDLADPYALPWLTAAHIVFCSHERLPCPPGDWIRRMLDRYPRCAMVGVGLGARGCVLGLRDGRLVEAGAVAPRGVVSCSGAGDALFATFLHGWLATGSPAEALSLAVLHAGWKIGDRFPGAASLTEPQLRALRDHHPVELCVRSI